ncbi:MAG: hypothetical protein ACF8Q5_07865 [Phycisphaerales bacterium JB040]
MKLKGIKPIEQHVEKIVLGVVAVVFVAVLAMQMLGKPLTVKVDGKDERPENAVERSLADKARRALEQMGRDAGAIGEGEDGLPPVGSAGSGLASAWDDKFGAPSGTEFAVAPLVPASDYARITAREGDIPEEELGSILFEPLTVPAPAKPMASVYLGTLDPFVVSQSAELAAFVPAEQPYDKAAVTIEAVVDGTAIREKLESDPDGEASQYAAVPSSWWSDNIAVLKVEVERIEGFDGSGNPINPVMLVDAPGRGFEVPSFGGATPSPEQFQTVVDAARARTEWIVQPAYYPVIAGPEWRSPSQVAQLEEIESRRDEINLNLRRYEALAEQVAEKERELAELRGGPTGPRGGTPANTGQPDQAVQRRIERTQGELDALNQRLEAQESTLTALGVDTEGNPILGEDDESQEMARDRLLSLLDNEEMAVWRHDLTAERGKTYRYRTRITVNNPLFGYTRELAEEQRPLAAETMVVGEWSAWSDPVSVPDETVFFVTAANPGNGLDAAPRATLEAYRFFYGYWRPATISVTPGEMIRGEAELPDPKLLPIWTAETLALGLDGGGRGLNRQDPRRGPGRPGGARPPLEAGEEVQLPPGTVAGPASIPVAIETMLLDVASVPGSGRSSRASQAYFRTPSNPVQVRNPVLDGQSPLLERVRESAEAGRRQGQAEPEPEPEPEVIRQPERLPPPRDPREQGPKGGGGGGGG